MFLVFQFSNRLLSKYLTNILVINIVHEIAFAYYRIVMAKYGNINIWLGGYYSSSSTWIWVDGSPVPSGGWQSGEPAGSSPPKDCIGYSLGTGATGWSDYPCEFQFNYVCQIDDPSVACKLSLTSMTLTCAYK